MTYIRKIKDYAIIGGLGSLAVLGLAACNQQGSDTQSNTENQANTLQDAVNKGAFVVIEEDSKGQYHILEEYPSSAGTRIVLRKPDGSEEILSEEKIQALLAEANQSIENNTSPLTNPTAKEAGGLSLGEVILSSAAGAIIGSWIGSKLFNNPNYQQARSRGYSSPSAYSRSVNNFKNANIRPGAVGGTAAKKSGSFFGGGSKSSGSSSAFGG
ncbi:UPF0323 family lipoprotein [Stenoxybacter acetivorans]|uniref:UPF0323 family lipoprotein n=1 Tax=Stenoxybacter acetivorans TaxID=422441 RepID=UPI000563F225|nr:UPF0323 family lipoprotein [Stenoxybacter acetivorans]